MFLDPYKLAHDHMRPRKLSNLREVKPVWQHFPDPVCYDFHHVPWREQKKKRQRCLFIYNQQHSEHATCTSRLSVPHASTQMQFPYGSCLQRNLICN